MRRGAEGRGAINAGLLWLAFAAATAAAEGGSGPRVRADGPNASAYGIGENYPTCTGLDFVREARCRVGALSHFDTLFPARTVAASSAHAPLRRAAKEPGVHYTYAGQPRTIEQYLARRPITGFLIARGDTILIERYQYARSAEHRFVSFSMAKTITGLLVGIAVDDGSIRSIDDLAEAYVPGLRGTVYGRTSIRALLEMRSGVFFREDYADPASDIYTLARLTLEQDPGGSLAAVKRFDWRRAPPGSTYAYSSADTVVLGLVLAGATGRTLSDYAAAKLWQPLGAEAAASWVIDATGQEITFGYFSAVLRDWARLGMMLAHDGTWSGKTIVPGRWLAASRAAAIDTGSALSRYGYQVFLSADTRRFMLWGLRGQFVLVDPDTKLVLVQTALAGDDFLDLELYELWSAARAQLR